MFCQNFLLNFLVMSVSKDLLLLSGLNGRFKAKWLLWLKMKHQFLRMYFQFLVILNSGDGDFQRCVCCDCEA